MWLCGTLVLCTVVLSVRAQMTMMSMQPLMNNRTNKQIAAIVTGLPILEIPSYGLLDFFKEEVMNQRILIFRKEGKLSQTEQIKVAHYFGGELEEYPARPGSKEDKEDEIHLVTNDDPEGLKNVGSKGWHMDGYLHEKPHSHCVYHMTAIATKGPTMFVPLDDIVDALPADTKARWDRIWIRCAGEPHIVHPLIYHHPVTGFETMCIHTAFASELIWDYGMVDETVGTQTELDELLEEVNAEFNKDDGYWHYLHYWEEGDVIITDNLSVGELAHPDSQLPSSQIGLRVLQRACVLGQHVPKKNPGAPKPTSKKLADDEEGDFDDEDDDGMSEPEEYTFDATQLMGEKGGQHIINDVKLSPKNAKTSGSDKPKDNSGQQSSDNSGQQSSDKSQQSSDKSQQSSDKTQHIPDEL